MMNSTLETIYQHKSIRKFKDQPLSLEQNQALMKVISSVPTSINGQNFSVIVIEDPQIRAKITEYARGQEYIKKAPLFLVIVADFYRSSLAIELAGKKIRAHKSIESLLVGSVDIGIVLGQLIVAAESLGLGTVPIGAIRGQSQKMVELLNLPKYTFPVVGLCVGVPDQNPDIKPRLNPNAVIFKDTYQKEDLINHIKDYDKTLTEYNQSSRNLNKNWSESISGVYRFPYYPIVDGSLKKQGFKILSRPMSYILNKITQLYIKKNIDKLLDKK